MDIRLMICRTELEYHRKCRDEVVLSIVRTTDDVCVGHVGLYKSTFVCGRPSLQYLLGIGIVGEKGLDEHVPSYAAVWI